MAGGIGVCHRAEGRKRGKTAKRFYTRCVCESHVRSEACEHELGALDPRRFIILKLKRQAAKAVCLLSLKMVRAEGIEPPT